jgi:hypothetical protein
MEGYGLSMSQHPLDISDLFKVPPHGLPENMSG